MGKHSRLEDLTHEELERRLQEAKALRLSGGRRIGAAEREMLRHTLASHRAKLLAQRAALALEIGDLLAQVKRLDAKLDDIERSEFWLPRQD